MRNRVVVVGGGVAGLAVAYELTHRGDDAERPEVLCLEAGSRAGGNIQSTREDGFLYEWAANGFLDNAPATLDLVERLGLGERLIRARDAAGRRFIYRKGKLREVPLSPPAFLRSGIIPWSGKLRLLAEPLIPQRKDEDEESVYDFAARRIGHSAASVLVDAMVSGVYAGDVRRLSLEATFPKMREMESKYGGLMKAMLAKRKEAKASGAKAAGPAGPGGTLCSFPDGLEELTDALAAALGDRLKLETPVVSVSDMGQRGFRVHLERGAPIETDAVILACPAWTAAPIVEPVDAEIASILSGIPSAPIAVLHLGYRLGALGDKPEGFGFLVPRGQGVRMLGTLWTSDIFEQLAPEGSLLLTCMIGGAHDLDAVELRDDRLLEIVRGDLKDTMGIVAATPYFVRILRHPRGIPQYDLGHVARVKALASRLESHPGLWLTGNSYRGISVNACVTEAPDIADDALKYLASSRGTAAV